MFDVSLNRDVFIELNICNMNVTKIHFVNGLLGRYFFMMWGKCYRYIYKYYFGAIQVLRNAFFQGI